MSFGNILRELINAQGITQKQLALNLNIAASTLGNYIQDSREPDFETLKRMADYFDVSVDYLLSHHSKKASNFTEDELLHILRSLTPEQQEIYIELGKAIMRLNKKKPNRDM